MKVCSDLSLKIWTNGLIIRIFSCLSWFTNLVAWWTKPRDRETLLIYSFLRIVFQVGILVAMLGVCIYHTRDLQSIHVVDTLQFVSGRLLALMPGTNSMVVAAGTVSVLTGASMAPSTPPSLNSESHINNGVIEVTSTVCW